MKKVLLLTFVLYFSSLYWRGAGGGVNAQNPDLKRTTHWYFGNKCGLDFSSGSPVADSSSEMAVGSNSAVMSDTNGHLLFYTDGITVWNKNHLMMQNGDTIGVGQFAAPRNRCVIIPHPGNDSLYFIFTIDGWQHQYKNGMMYSLVNLNSNNGLGKVIKKGKQLFTPAAEMLAATKDVTGCGYWIASHTRHSDSFMVYHVTEQGLDTVPVISRAGSDYNRPQQFYQFSGGYNLVFSPKGNIAAVIIEQNWFAVHHNFDSLDILNFNNSNGYFSSLVVLSTDTTAYTGITFSPNGLILYNESGFLQSKMYQFDVSSLNSTSIINSRQLVYKTNNLGLSQDFLIGLNGLIYANCEVSVGDSLSYIANPNVIGVGCRVHKGGIPLNGRLPQQGLPNFVSNFLINDATLNCKPNAVAEVIPETDFILFPNPANDEFSMEANKLITHFKLTDLLGKTIQSKNIQSLKYHYQCFELAAGMYIIQLTLNSNQKLSKKIIINHK
jgi:hypothetical protein